MVGCDHVPGAPPTDAGAAGRSKPAARDVARGVRGQGPAVGAGSPRSARPAG